MYYTNKYNVNVIASFHLYIDKLNAINSVSIVLQDLISDLKSELSGDLEELILALFKSTEYYDAWCLNKAMRVRQIETAISFCLISSFQAEILWFNQ